MAGTYLDRYLSIFGPDGFLKRMNVERDEDIDLLGLSMISGVDILFLGDFGVGKTYMIELLVDHCLANMTLFTHLLAKDQSADEVLGPRDIMALKRSEIRRMIEGFLPSANYAYLDEIFKSSPPMLNPMLDLYAKRQLKVGGQVLDCSQLLSIVMSSNELPQREDLGAFRDRIGVTKFVKAVETPEGLRAVSDLQLDQQRNGVNADGVVPLTLDEVYAIREEVNQIEVPDVVREMMTTAELKWAEHGHGPSQRRKGQMWKMVKSTTWAAGRKTVSAIDLMVCQHMAWNLPDHRATAREVVLEFAGVFIRAAARIRETQEATTREIGDLKRKADAAQPDERDEILNPGLDLMRSLKRTAREARRLIGEGQTQGQDTAELEGVLAEINQNLNWAQDILTGTDDEED